ncbi:MAG: hypothetical protein IKE15_06350 [Clostridia bacterium]|nr:hypothetical protein [Clostridia bacterium]
MEFREQYPNRVTMGEDGIYRWSADVDLSRDHYVQNLTIKIMLFICAGICLMTLIFAIMTGDVSMAWIPVLCCGAVMVITMLVLRLFRSGVKDRYTMGYEMTGEGIRLVRDPATARMMKRAAAFARGGAGTVQPGETEFRSVRSMREVPETHMICLNTTVSALQIWVPEEDYDVVCNYIRQHADRVY